MKSISYLPFDRLIPMVKLQRPGGGRAVTSTPSTVLGSHTAIDDYR